MATRFYLPSTGAADVSPAYTHQATWNDSAGGDRLKCVTTKISSAMASKTVASAIAAGQRCLWRQYVSAPINAQTIAVGTIKGTVRVLESAINDNVDNISCKVIVVSRDGGTYRGAIWNLGEGVAVLEFATSLTNRRVADGDATLAVTAQQGDRIVIELGYRTSTTGTSISASGNFGDDSATDCADDQTGTAANNPFVELSGNITFEAPLLYLRNATPPEAPSAGEKSAVLPVGTTPNTGPPDYSLSLTIGASALYSGVNTSATTAHQDVYVRRFSSPRLAAQTIAAGQWAYGFNLYAANTAANAFTVLSLYVWRPSTQTVVGYIYDSDTTLGTEWTTSFLGDVATFNGSAVTTIGDDVLVLEAWAHAVQDDAVSRGIQVNFNGAVAVSQGTANDGSWLAPVQTLTWGDPFVAFTRYNRTPLLAPILAQ